MGFVGNGVELMRTTSNGVEIKKALDYSMTSSNAIYNTPLTVWELYLYANSPAYIYTEFALNQDHDLSVILPPGVPGRTQIVTVFNDNVNGNSVTFKDADGVTSVSGPHGLTGKRTATFILFYAQTQGWLTTYVG
jgi:hypothetical protein